LKRSYSFYGTLKLTHYCVCCTSFYSIPLFCLTSHVNVTLARAATRSSFRGGEMFMKFHSMTSSCLFNRGTTFSQAVTYNNIVFCPQTRSP